MTKLGDFRSAMKRRLPLLLLLSSLVLLSCGEDEAEPGPSLLDVEGYDWLADARFNPAGNRLAIRAQKSGLEFDLITVDLDGGNIVVLATDVPQSENLAWSGDGQYVYYQGDWPGGRAGKAILRSLQDGSGVPELVTLKSGGYIDVSSDGTTLLFGGSIFPISLAPLDVLPIPEESEVETAVVGNSPRFSPNGSKLLYQNGAGSPNAFRYMIADTETWEVIQVGPVGSDFIGSAAWINDEEFIYDGQDGVWRSDGVESERIYDSRSFGIDANPATQTYLDSGQSGSRELAIRSL